MVGKDASFLRVSSRSFEPARSDLSGGPGAARRWTFTMMHDNVTPSLVAQEQRNHQMTVRIPKRIHGLIKVQAEDERRSVADIVNHVLAAHYSARDNARSRR
jgi:hypothetical protein